MPAVTTVTPTGNPYVNGVLGDIKWAVGSLSFSFPSSAAYYGTTYGDGEPQDNFGALNAAQQAATRSILSMYSSVVNLRFGEIAENSTRHADLRFASSDAPSTAWGYFPSTAPEGGDLWFNKSSGSYSRPVKGNYAYASFIHEIGHALGLKHPHEVEGIFGAMPADRDSLEYTVMSYRSYVGASTTTGYTNETGGFPQSLMMYDIAALQYMYGANFTTRSGNSTYQWSPTTGELFIDGLGQGAPVANRILQTVWDGGGTDTYDFSTYSTPLKIDLRPGEWTTTSTTQLAKLHWDGSKVAVGNIANALQYNGDARSLIENAIGGLGDDMIIGNGAGNVLDGRSGADVLNGGGGSDVFIFKPGYGRDTIVDFTTSAGDKIDLSGFSSVGSIADVLSHASQVATDTIIDLGAGDTVTLRSVAKSSLVTANFALGNHIDLGAASPGWEIKAAADMSGDGRADILWHNGQTGEAYLWDVAGGQRGSLGFASPGWSIREAVDLTSDGRADILWHHATTGEAYLWDVAKGLHYSLGSASPGWSIRSAADLTGDGRADILWHNEQTGEAYLWEIVGGQSGSLGGASPGWKIVDAADLNGDGTADILWHNAQTGEAYVWDVARGPRYPLGSASPGSSIKQAADLTGDGRADIVWHHSQTGEAYSWDIATGAHRSYGTGPAGYEIKAVEDLTGDAHKDILWHNAATGDAFLWDL
jgi:serralysin